MIPQRTEVTAGHTKTRSRRIGTTEDAHVAAYLQTAFEDADADGSGHLSAEEFSELLLKMAFGLNEEQVKMLYKEMDSDGDGALASTSLRRLHHSC